MRKKREENKKKKIYICISPKYNLIIPYFVWTMVVQSLSTPFILEHLNHFHSAQMSMSHLVSNGKLWCGAYRARLANIGHSKNKIEKKKIKMKNKKKKKIK